jgi:hypothetical protein
MKEDPIGLCFYGHGYYFFTSSLLWADERPTLLLGLSSEKQIQIPSRTFFFYFILLLFLFCFVLCGGGKRKQAEKRVKKGGGGGGWCGH